MPDPFAILGLPADAADDAIRRRYLELIRTHTPDRDPDRFAAVRGAYDKLRDPITRLEYRLFGTGDDDSIETLLGDAHSATPTRRATVDELLSLGRRHA